MRQAFIIAAIAAICTANARGDQPTVLFDGSSLSGWEFRPGGWVIDDQGAMTCRMEEVKQKDGKTRTKSMGYIWTKASYENFTLTLNYKLSAGANSGIFYRTDPENPVQGGFEIQLLDNEGFQKVKGKKDPKNLNGAFYDCQGPKTDPAKPVGQWNQLTLTCQGPHIQLDINGVRVNQINIDHWDTPNQNPDGSANKFKTALNKLPRSGRIGFQNHGQVVWIKDVVIRTLP
jgi:hypothetical protein